MSSNLCLYLFIAFFKISFLTVGGGPVMLAVMDQEFRERKKFLSESEMADVFAIIYSMPGAIGVNSALVIGNKLGGKKGALSAFCGVITPPVVVILFVTSLVEMIKNSPFTGYAFISIRAAVSVFIVCTIGKLLKNTIRCWKDAVICLFAFLSVEFTGLPAIYAIAACGLLGLFFYRKGDL